MHDIDIYNNSMAVLMKKEEKIYIKFIIFFIIGLIFLTVLLFVKYPKEYHFEGITSNNEIVLYLSKKDLKCLKGNTIIIDNKSINYQIKSIVQLENLVEYYSVRIYTNEDYVDNDVIDFKIDDGYTTLFNSLKQKIWKGLTTWKT